MCTTLTEEEKKLISMELHQEITIGDDMRVRRVIGGWLYTKLYFTSEETIINQTFVPDPYYTLKK